MNLRIGDTTIAEHPILFSDIMSLFRRHSSFQVMLETGDDIPSMACCLVQICTFEIVYLKFKLRLLESFSSVDLAECTVLLIAYQFVASLSGP